MRWGGCLAHHAGIRNPCTSTFLPLKSSPQPATDTSTPSNTGTSTASQSGPCSHLYISAHGIVQLLSPPAELTPPSTLDMPPKNPTLRDIPPGATILQPSAGEQRSQKISDKDANGYERVLPDNETLVMAMNEVAAKHARGFFYYLPFREAWKKTDSVDLFPKSRVPDAPGSVTSHFVILVVLTIADRNTPIWPTWTSNGVKPTRRNSHKTRSELVI
jgi:hypothetical protein